MYKISVPVMMKTLENYDPLITVKQLKDIGADRVFLCPTGDKRLWTGYDSEMSALKKNVSLMKENGFEVGVWVWTFMYEKPSDFTYMVNPEGKESNSCICPTDLNYRELMGKFVEDAAKTGVDLIMFDDDYRYGFIDITLGCFCKNHIRMINDITNEENTREQLKKHILSGGRNKYRDAYLKANGKALEDFAFDMRKHLDKINPSCRMGFCACITSWDFDGTTPDRIARALAGKTKPFYRLIGAPYWANNRSWGNRLADVIEMERLESAFREDSEIEIFSECDTFPRPRYKVPAAYAEGFDTSLRVAGCTDGILKYIIDYSADPLTETGYLRQHVKNKDIYKHLDEMFGNKTECGIKVWYTPDKIRNMDISVRDEYNSDRLINYDFPYTARMVTGCSLPAVFGADAPCGIAFGEDVKAVPDDKLNGLILDLKACEILNEKGIDTGIISTEKEYYSPETEVFTADNNHISLGGEANARKVTISSNAVITSLFHVKDDQFTGSYRYENEKGQRFLVFCFDGYENCEGLFRQYGRQKQIIQNYEWLCGCKLPAYCANNPDLYIQCKSDGNRLAVALWNFCADEIEEPVVNIYENCSICNTIRCTAKVSADKVKLSRIEPFGMAFFEVEIIK